MSMSPHKIRYGSLAFAFCAAVALSSSAACDQPKPKCNIGRGSFAARYTVISGPASCADLKGEQLGTDAYNPAGKGGRPELDVTSIAIRAASLGTLAQNAAGTPAADPDPSHHPHALGTFSTAEPEDDFCTVPTFAPAIQNLGAIEADPDNDVAAQPATQVTYDWKNVRVYVTSTAAGTQLTGEVTITTDGVACGYSVVAMYPYVDCSAPDPNDKDKTVPDDEACKAEPDPDKGRPTGSGISPDFPVKCDPDLLACFLTSDHIPVLR